MLLATRALGLGTTLTTRHTGYGKEFDAIFGLPPGVHSYAILPIGWPMGRFGPLGRGPLKDVDFQDQWGKPYSSRRLSDCDGPPCSEFIRGHGDGRQQTGLTKRFVGPADVRFAG